MEKRLEKAFKEGALFITLTYKGESPSEKVVNRELHKFLLRLKHWRRKNGLSALKYVAVTELKKARVHHHILINPMDISQAKMTELWGFGKAKIDKPVRQADYPGIVRYLAKEDSNGQRIRWMVSKNINSFLGGIEN